MAGVGNEAKADMKGTGVCGPDKLSHAMAHLKSQFPAHPDHSRMLGGKASAPNMKKGSVPPTPKP